MYLNKIKIQKAIKRFKCRKQQKITYNENYFKLKNFIINFNCISYIYCRNILFMELRFYKLYFLKLRRMNKKKKISSYVYIMCNHSFSRKPKASRMGKGKGRFVRFVFRTKVMKPIFIFNKISNMRLTKFINYLNGKSRNNFFCFFFC